MKKQIFTVCLLLFSYISFAQYGSIVSTNTSGKEYASDLIFHSNSNFYLVGTLDPGPLGNEDIFISKIDTSNNLIWSKVYGKADYNSPTDIKELNDSNILMIGYNFNPPGYIFSATINKLDQNGDTLWTRNIFDSNNKDVFLKYLDDSGDTIRLFGGYGNNVNKGIIVAISSTTGDFFWAKDYTIPNNISTGFYKGKTCKTSNRAYILASAITDSISFNEKEFLCVINRNGDVINLIEIADSASGYSSLLNVSDQTGDVIIGMNNRRNAQPGGTNYLLCLLDSALNLKFTKEFGPGFGVTTMYDAIITDSVKTISLLGGASYIYLLDSTGNIISVNKVYNDPLHPGALAFLSKIITSSNMLVGAGGISLSGGGSHENVLFSKARLDGTGCQNSLLFSSNLSVPVSMLPGIMSVDTVNTLYSLSSINYISVNTNFNIVCQTTGLADNGNIIDLKMFPIPVDESFTLSGLPEDKKYKIQVFDCLGKTVSYQNMSVNETTIKINIGKVLSGLYLLSISDEAGIIITKRFVKI